MATFRTKPLHRYRVTRLGFHFLFVAMFAIIGGSLRGFNLLLVLAGLLIAVVVIQWRQGRGAIRQIRVHRENVPGAFAGKPVSIRYDIRNVGRWIPVWMVRVEDHVVAQTVAQTLPQIIPLANQVTDQSAQAEAAARPISLVGGVGNVPADQTRSVSITCRFSQRGRYKLGPIVASTTFPFSLISCERLTAQSADEFYVYPPLIELRRGWKALLPPRRGGDGHRSTAGTNHDGDFFGLRPWQSGDQVKHIHWRTTARINQPAVRQFEQRNRHQICVIVDMITIRNPRNQDATERVLQLATTLLRELATQTRGVALLVADSIDSGTSNHPNRHQDQTCASELWQSNGADLSELLKRLAISQPGMNRPNSQDRLAQVVVESAQQLMPFDLVVVSTRSMEDANRVWESADRPCSSRSVWRHFNQSGRLSWINVHSKNVIRFMGDAMHVGQANQPVGEGVHAKS